MPLSTPGAAQHARPAERLMGPSAAIAAAKLGALADPPAPALNPPSGATLAVMDDLSHSVLGADAAVATPVAALKHQGVKGARPAEKAGKVNTAAIKGAIMANVYVSGPTGAEADDDLAGAPLPGPVAFTGAAKLGLGIPTKAVPTATAKPAAAAAAAPANTASPAPAAKPTTAATQLNAAGTWRPAVVGAPVVVQAISSTKPASTKPQAAAAQKAAPAGGRRLLGHSL